MVGGLAVGSEHAAALHRDPLRAVQQLGGAEDEGVVAAGNDVVHDRLGDPVDEERRQVDRAGPEQRQVPGLERSRGEHGIAEAEEVRVVVARVGVGELEHVERSDRARGRCLHELTKLFFVGVRGEHARKEERGRDRQQE